MSPQCPPSAQLVGPEPSDHQCSPHCPELGALGNGIQHQPGQNCKAASVRLSPSGAWSLPLLADPQNSVPACRQP